MTSASGPAVITSRRLILVNLPVTVPSLSRFFTGEEEGGGGRESTTIRRLTKISRRDVWFRSNSDNYWCHTPTNLSPTRIKSSRERKNARLAAQIMKACLEAKNSVKYHTGKMKGKSGNNRDKNFVIKSICHSTKGLKSQCISQSKDPPIIIEHWE